MPTIAPARSVHNDHAARVVLRRSTVELAATTIQSNEPRTFESVPYSGEPFDYYGRCIIDLATLATPESGIVTPLLYDHGYTADNPRIGKVTEFVNDGSKLTAKGEMLRNASADSIVADADQGFPFQQSLGLDIGRVEFVEPGNSVTVNGRTLQGPVEVWRDCTINELSFVVLGADSNTTAAILSRITSSKETDMSKTKELAKKAGTTETAAGVAAELMAAEDDMVRVGDITADWIKENLPSIAAAFTEADDDDEAELADGKEYKDEAAMAEGAEAVEVEDEAQMSKPASVEQLEAIAASAKLSDPDGFVLGMLKTRSSASLAKAHAELLSKSLRKAELGKESAGVAPVKTETEATSKTVSLSGVTVGRNPAAAFDRHQPLQDACAKLGRSKSWWTNFATAELNKGRDPIKHLEDRLNAAN